MKRKISHVLIMVLAFGLMACSGGGDQAPINRTQGVYMLIDTSGTYSKELGKALSVINYLLGTMNPGDVLAVAKVSSRWPPLPTSVRR